MARKKIEMPPLVNRLKGSHDVQKSLPLFSLWKSDLTLSEFKILDTYLARINSHKPEQRTVIFEKGELEKLLGVKQLKSDDLKKRLKQLMSHVIEFKDNEYKKGFKLISLFSMAECDKDENDQWQVELSCTQEAMKYFFNVDDIGYLRYKLSNIINLTSRYSYVLFIYLKPYRFKKTIDVDLVDIKHILNCHNESAYNEFKIFNNRILKKCHKEINEKTELRYTYEPLKKGRKVVAIRFTIETLADFAEYKFITEPNQIDFDSLENNSISFLAEACNNEFSEKEMDHIFQLICQVQFDSKEDINIARYHLLAEKYSKLNLADERATTSGKPIKNRFAYFSKIIII